MRLARFAAATAALTLAVGGFAASTSFAVGNPGGGHPHYISGPDFSETDHDTVEATGSIAGLGNQDVTIVLTAKAVAGCDNGHNKPKGLSRTVSSPPTTYSPDDNGKVDFDVETAAVEVKCPGKKMTSFVDFTSATLTATVGDVVLTNTHEFTN